MGGFCGFALGRGGEAHGAGGTLVRLGGVDCCEDGGGVTGEWSVDIITNLDAWSDVQFQACC